tara:strand:- start:2425 stop:2985 length:561 start_codon:yes stop_codon:yes gene_type:complete
MISFNNKKIEELSYNELSQQLFNISRYYSDFNINPEYTTMFLCIGDYLESGFSGYNFSIKTFIKYNKDKQISLYEKYILIYSYRKFLNGIIDFNKNKKAFYQSIIYLLNSLELSHKYIHFFNLSNTKNPEKSIFLKKEKYLNDIKNSIINIKDFENKVQKKEIKNILKLSLEELNYCYNIDNLICI